MAGLFDDIQVEVDPRQQSRRERLRIVQDRLCEEYGCPIDYFHSLSPMCELVSSFLNHRTRNADSSRAYKALRSALPTWDQVADAPVDSVERVISEVRWPEQKASRLQAILRQLRGELGAINDDALDFLAHWSVDAARTWLERLSGVGPKTSAATLSFSNLRMRAMPVDSHHHRVAERLDLIDAGTSVGPAHEALDQLLPESWDAQVVYDHHEVMMFHGQRVCRPKPNCEGCVLRDLCPSARRVWV